MKYVEMRMGAQMPSGLFTNFALKRDYISAQFVVHLIACRHLMMFSSRFWAEGAGGRCNGRLPTSAIDRCVPIDHYPDPPARQRREPLYRQNPTGL